MTRGKIDPEGYLWIYRKNRYKAQNCPKDSKSACCGDWCPLWDDRDLEESGLSLCELSLLDIVDERVETNEIAKVI